MKRIKTTVTNIEKRNSVRKAMLKELINVNYSNKVAVDIYGSIHYLTKDQVRALQIVAAKIALQGSKVFKEFTDNVIVYSGRDITHSKHVMHWQPNGKFIETFDKGFMTANDELVEKLYDLIDK